MNKRVGLSSFLIGFLGLTPLAFAYTDRDIESLMNQVLVLRTELRQVFPIGSILPYSGTQAIPEGFALCDGSFHPVEGDWANLFEVIGYTYTSEASRAARPGEFQVPDLRGRTPVGDGRGTMNGKSLSTRILGEGFGAENYSLTQSNLPNHVHSGITGDQNSNHTHSGRTGNDSPDHSHIYQHHSGSVPIYDGVHLNHSGAHHNIAANVLADHASGGKSTPHQHDFSTAYETQSHQHEFTTNSTSGARALKFNLSQPSLVVRYLIKVKHTTVQRNPIVAAPEEAVR